MFDDILNLLEDIVHKEYSNAMLYLDQGSQPLCNYGSAILYEHKLFRGSRQNWWVQCFEIITKVMSIGTALLQAVEVLGGGSGIRIDRATRTKQA